MSSSSLLTGWHVFAQNVPPTEKSHETGAPDVATSPAEELPTSHEISLLQYPDATAIVYPPLGRQTDSVD